MRAIPTAGTPRRSAARPLSCWRTPSAAPRTPPTCGRCTPHTRDWSPPWRREGLASAPDEGVVERPDALDLDADPLAGRDRPDTARRPGEDDVAGQEGEGGRGVRDEVGDLVDHVGR